MKAEDCKTKDDILLHLVYHLEPVNEIVVIEDFTQIMGFRRAFHITSVWYSKLQNKYASHVASDDDLEQSFIRNPNLGLYDSFYELLDGVATIYSKKWLKNDVATIYSKKWLHP